MDNLPDKLSELLLVALADLTRCENDPRYEIFMSDWHAPWAEDDEPEQCYVCMAGAVIAKTLSMPCTDNFGPDDFVGTRGNTRNKLLAINALRTGRVAQAMVTVGIRLADREGEHSLDRNMVDYHDDKEQFHIQMNALATDLEKAGL